MRLSGVGAREEKGCNMKTQTLLRNAFVILGVALLHVTTGCRPPVAAGTGLAPVRIASPSPDANTAVTVSAEAPCRYCDLMPFERVEGNERAYADLLLMPGDLLPLKFQRKQDGNELGFWYVFSPQDSQPLAFRSDGPAALLAGKTVALDLNYPNGTGWPGSHGPGDMGTIRAIRLCGDMETNLAALGRLAHSGVLIDCSDQFAFDREGNRRLADAIVDADPTGLILKDASGLERYLPRMKNLTHLVMTWPAEKPLPSLAQAERLQVVYLELSPAPGTQVQDELHGLKVDLRRLGLDRLPRLHTLFLYGKACRYLRDLAALNDLKQLRQLTIADCDQLRDLSSLPHLYDLTGLEIINGDSDAHITGIEHLARFQGLVKLSLFCKLADNADLRVLGKLKDLKILVLPKDVIKERAADVDAIRKALPNCRIYGMCMGSRWIIAILAVGVTAGLVRHRFRRGRTRKRLVAA
jgi:hypothetical protein